MREKIQIEKSWKKVLEDYFRTDEWQKVSTFVKGEYKTEKVFPAPNNIFNAFNFCPFDDVKVVILGQDPYHGAGQAHGLCFSVPDGVRTPPSLQNIYKEIENDLGKTVPVSGNLEKWAKQGVLLMNATLTVRGGQAGSHQGKGWEVFTDVVIKKISEEKEHVAFMLWGNYAKNKGQLIDKEKHLVLEAAHPSPFSAYNGFFGCKHFSKANEYLIKNNISEICW